MCTPNKCLDLLDKYKYLITTILLISIVTILIYYDWVISEKYCHLNFPITSQLSAVGSILSSVFAFYAVNISYRTWRNDKYLTYIQRFNEAHEKAFKQLNEILPHLEFSQDGNMGQEPYKAAADETKNILNFEKYKNLLREYERFKSPYPYHLKLIKLLSRLEQTYNQLGFSLLFYIDEDEEGVWTSGEKIEKQKVDRLIKHLLKLESCFSKTREKMLSHLYQQIHKI